MSLTNPSLTHLNARGEAHMVDVADKPESRREASASGLIRMRPATQIGRASCRERC